MSFGKLVCIVLAGAVIFLIGVFFGAATIEKINDEYDEIARQKAHQIQKERRNRYEMKRLKAEA